MIPDGCIAFLLTAQVPWMLPITFYLGVTMEGVDPRPTDHHAVQPQPTHRALYFAYIKVHRMLEIDVSYPAWHKIMIDHDTPIFNLSRILHGMQEFCGNMILLIGVGSEYRTWLKDGLALKAHFH